jgi:hypothetical protein
MTMEERNLRGLVWRSKEVVARVIPKPTPPGRLPVSATRLVVLWGVSIEPISLFKPEDFSE